MNKHLGTNRHVPGCAQAEWVTWVLMHRVDSGGSYPSRLLLLHFVSVFIFSYKDTTLPTKVNSHAEVSAHLPPLTLPCKAESVVSLTSQCSYSSTIVHVGDKKPQPELGMLAGSWRI